MTTHFSISTAPSRIGISTELLPLYCSRETLVHVTPQLFNSGTTFLGQNRAKVEFSLSLVNQPFAVVSDQPFVSEGVFRVRSSFLRRFRSSRVQVFSPSFTLGAAFSNYRVTLNRRFLPRQLGYATLLSSGNSRFAASWLSGFTSVSRHATPSSLFPVLSGLVGAPVHFLGVNALTLARYGRDQEVRDREQSAITTTKNNSSFSSPSRAFLRQRETERGSRYASVAAALPDLLRLTFLSLYLKKAPFLARILAYSLTTLPRNRKETLFLRFLRKLVKVFAAQRPERLGIRLRVQGRVNRWRRTKHRVGERGRLPLYSYSARLEYGEAQALTRKGALGFRL